MIDRIQAARRYIANVCYIANGKVGLSRTFWGASDDIVLHVLVLICGVVATRSHSIAIAGAWYLNWVRAKCGRTGICNKIYTELLCSRATGTTRHRVERVRTIRRRV